MRWGPILPALLGLALMAGGGAAVAQEDECPDGHFCTEYVYEGEPYPVEIDRRETAACIVVEAVTSTVRTIAGEREGEASAWCVLYVARGDGYEVGVERIDIDPRRAALADPGEDALVLRFAEVQD